MYNNRCVWAMSAFLASKMRELEPRSESSCQKFAGKDGWDGKEG
jgi:hypothetical protein